MDEVTGVFFGGVRCSGVSTEEVVPGGSVQVSVSGLGTSYSWATASGCEGVRVHGEGHGGYWDALFTFLIQDHALMVDDFDMG